MPEANEKLNKAQIEQHLKSAVDTLTPNILDRIDLSTPQDVVPYPYYVRSGWQRRMRAAVLTAAACLCIAAMGGGTFYYHAMNRVVESVIGLDVNPSVELSVNRKNRVLEASALNEEAVIILGDMDLEGVDVNVAVNAVVGSMVTNGYFDELDNAILVTVTNDSISKASQLRTSIVDDIEKTLEENQVQAVVYDQQVIERDEIKQLAQQYGISYGKAYFLKELIDQNKELTMDDMEKLSAMTMEEIAAEIANSSYQLGDFVEQKEEPARPVQTSEAETTTTEPVTEGTSSAASTTDTSAESTTPETTTQAPTTETETEEAIKADRVEIDYVDYEDGSVYVYFVTRVKWKNPTVSIRDENGDSFAAMISDTSSSECVIEVSGLEGGKSYTFVLGGLYPVEGGGATTVTGYFNKPMIAGELETDDDDDEEETATAAESKNPTKPESTEATKETQDESKTEETTAKEPSRVPETTSKESQTTETNNQQTKAKEPEQ
ncbi:MAG: anti-sigma-I factor RsgI family protein [Lachnospiraceae bacterium]